MQSSETGQCKAPGPRVLRDPAETCPPRLSPHSAWPIQTRRPPGRKSLPRVPATRAPRTPPPSQEGLFLQPCVCSWSAQGLGSLIPLPPRDRGPAREPAKPWHFGDPVWRGGACGCGPRPEFPLPTPQAGGAASPGLQRAQGCGTPQGRPALDGEEAGAPPPLERCAASRAGELTPDAGNRGEGPAIKPPQLRSPRKARTHARKDGAFRKKIEIVTAARAERRGWGRSVN